MWDSRRFVPSGNFGDQCRPSGRCYVGVRGGDIAAASTVLLKNFLGWGQLYLGRGLGLAGIANSTRLVFMIEAIQERVGRNGTVINWHFDDLIPGNAQYVFSGTDAALLVIKANFG